MIQILKKQGLKAALPLLLLATACGEGGSPSAFQLDEGVVSSDGAADVVATGESGMPDLAEMLETSTSGPEAEGGVAVKKVASYDDTAAKVPEPTTLAGLAVAALGLGAIKRKQSA
ncbi:MAG: PEP-CTERM sorting domain-containing protein [Cyanobacteria bacterium P01_F01_bin.53]